MHVINRPKQVIPTDRKLVILTSVNCMSIYSSRLQHWVTPNIRSMRVMRHQNEDHQTSSCMLRPYLMRCRRHSMNSVVHCDHYVTFWATQILRRNPFYTGIGHSVVLADTVSFRRFTCS